jgi:hypothetical protein
MHKNVEVLIGRLATDEGLLRRFEEQPTAALLDQRLELTEIELAALCAIDPAALRALADALDARIKKALPALECRAASDRNESPTQPHSTKEIRR